MSMLPVVIEQFPGLNLSNDPGEAAGALDVINITIERGRARTRDGSATFYTSTSKPYFLGRFRVLSTGADQLIVGESGGLISAFSQAGALLATTTVPVLNSRGLASVAVGTPANAYIYVADLTSVNGIRRWDGAAWTTPAVFAATPAVTALAVTPSDNRLVLGETSTVSFSNQGAPEVFGASDLVRLTPGDGEKITGAISFGNQVIVFKKTKFFVFFGQTTGSAGQTVFNYRTVDTGIGMQTDAPQSICKSPDSVYFIGNDGIYRTNGGPPQKISQAIDQFFNTPLSPYWRGTNSGSRWESTGTVQRLEWVAGKLYAALADTTGTDRVQLFVYDPQLQAWSAWDRNACSILGWPTTTAAGDARRLMLGNATAGSLGYNIGVHRPGLTTDADTSGGGATALPIFSRYRSAFNAFGAPGRKRLKEVLLTGSGVPGIQWSTDDGFLPLAVGGAVSLVAAPNISTSRQRTAYRGRNFSYQLDGGLSGNAWSVSRLEPIFSQPPRAPTVTSA